jgi:hypothetical protein
MSPGDERAALEDFLEQQLPGAAPLHWYELFRLPAAVSFELGNDLPWPRWEVLDTIADRAARIYERVFAPGDTGWIYAVKEAPLRAMLPSELTLADVESEGRLDLEAFVPQSVLPPAPSELAMLLEFVPADAAGRCTVGSGHNALQSPEFVDLCPEEGVPYVDVLVPVRPRDVDYRGLLRAVIGQDFPDAQRRALGGKLMVINRDHPAVFDLPDDRYCGVAAAETRRLLDVYGSGIAPLNDYRRAVMEQTFGFWPDDDAQR